MGASQSQSHTHSTNRNVISQSQPETSRIHDADYMSMPLTFHAVHGENVTLSNNNRIAKRAESFCKGICFSSRPIALGERVIIKFSETSTNWSGVLRVGFTSVDPENIRVSNLPRYACPDLTNKPGHWAKALSERYAELNNALYFYVTRDGTVMYGVNNQDKGSFFSGVNTANPLWVLADIYGNTIAIEINSEGAPNQNDAVAQPMNPAELVIDRQPTQPVNCASSSRASETRVVCPAVRYHTGVNFNVIRLSTLCGRNIQITANRVIATRSNDFCHGYIFTARPLKVGEKIVLQVLGTNLNYIGGLCFGVTTCDPATLTPADLPDDSDHLLDRKEYWVVNKDVCKNPDIGDELSFTLTHEGVIRYSRNNHRIATLMHVDRTLPLWVFFDLYGNLQMIRILGVTSNNTGRRPDIPTDGLCVNLPSLDSPSSPMQISPSDTPVGPDAVNPMIEEIPLNYDDANDVNSLSECTVCYECVVDSVIYTCGHMCMCYKCAQIVKNSHDALCPICRQEIKDVIKIYKS